MRAEICSPQSNHCCWYSMLMSSLYTCCSIFMLFIRFAFPLLYCWADCLNILQEHRKKQHRHVHQPDLASILRMRTGCYCLYQARPQQCRLVVKVHMFNKNLLEVILVLAVARCCCSCGSTVFALLSSFFFTWPLHKSVRKNLAGLKWYHGRSSELM